MKIYVIASKNNLAVLNEQLRKKYDSIIIHGTNDIEEGISKVASQHVSEEYDLLLITYQSFVEEDLKHQKKLSKKLNEHCRLAIKDLPVYFLVKSNNEKYKEQLKQTLTGKNVKLFNYDKLSMATVENIIKEVLVVTGTKKLDKAQIRKDVINEIERNKLNSEPSVVDQAISQIKTKNQMESHQLEKVKDLLNKVNEKTKLEKEVLNFGATTSILDRLKEGSLIEEKESTLIENEVAKEVKLEELTVLTSPEEVIKDLEINNEEYKNLHQVSEMIEKAVEVIKEEKATNPEFTNDDVIALYKEKSNLNNKMFEMQVNHLSEVSSSISEEIRKINNFNIDNISEYSLSIEKGSIVESKLSDIDNLKIARDKMESTSKSLIENLASSVNIYKSNFSKLGNMYIEKTKELEKSLIGFSNEEGIILEDKLITVADESVTKLKETFTESQKAVNVIINNSIESIDSLTKLNAVNKEIIDQQDSVIDILSTQNTMKVITVDNLLNVKSVGIFGLDNHGKSHTAINLSKSLSDNYKKKVLLVDLTTKYNSLSYYLKEEQTKSLTELHILNKQSISDLDIYVDNNNDTIDSLMGNSYEDILINKLKEVSDVYDKIILIFPENLNNFNLLIDEIGTSIYVSEMDFPSNEKSKDYKNYFEDKNKKSVNYLHVINKVSNKVNVSDEMLVKLFNINLAKYKLIIINEFSNSKLCKAIGKIPYQNNVACKTSFDDLVKKI